LISSVFYVARDEGKVRAAIHIKGFAARIAVWTFGNADEGGAL